MKYIFYDCDECCYSSTPVPRTAAAILRAQEEGFVFVGRGVNYKQYCRDCWLKHDSGQVKNTDLRDMIELGSIRNQYRSMVAEALANKIDSEIREASYMNKEKAKIAPIDADRCQAELKTGSFMSLGRREKKRCTNSPTTIVVEKKPGEDGLCGAMSLCIDCLDKFIRVHGKDYAHIFELISGGKIG